MDDEVSDTVTSSAVEINQEGNDAHGIEKTDSEILAADSHDYEDREIEDKRKQQYISRWASKNSVIEAASIDLEEESDVGASFDFTKRTR